MWKLVYILIASFVQHCSTISTAKNETAEILLNLANFAIESRQNQYPSYYQHQYHQNPRPSYYGVPQYYPQNINYYPQKYQRPYYPPPGQNYGYPSRPPQQGVMDILYSIATNDRLRCVPRLLCEVTSDTISRGRQDFALPSLPLNINLESIIGLLSTVDVGNGSPITSFAKAALLGYVSKGNSDSCLNSYPLCPRDPNALVGYLNNYNGGFFRFFNGINPTPNQYSPYYQNREAEQRIQNKPVHYVNNYISSEANYPTSSPNFNFKLNNNRSPKTLSFPNDDEYDANRFAFRKPKELPFPINHYYSNELDYQRPLPNHVATPMIFPDRTGTGNLRLDSEELEEHYRQTKYNLHNTNYISFNPLATNDFGKGPQDIGYSHLNNKPLFSFPNH